MPDRIEFNPSAFKHGVSEADIRKAIDRFIFEEPLEDFDNKYLLLGFDTKGILLEVYITILILILSMYFMRCRVARAFIFY